MIRLNLRSPKEFYTTHFLGQILICCPSRLELQNTPTASLQRGKTPPISVLDKTLNNLIVKLQ